MGEPLVLLVYDIIMISLMRCWKQQCSIWSL